MNGVRMRYSSRPHQFYARSLPLFIPLTQGSKGVGMPASVCRPLRNIDAEGAKNRHEYLSGGVLPRNVSFRRMIVRLSDSFPHAWGRLGSY